MQTHPTIQKRNSGIPGAFYKVPLYETSPDRLGQAIGKPGRMSAAIARGTLGEKLLALAMEEEAGNAPFQGR